MKKKLRSLGKKGSITDLGYIIAGIFSVFVVAFLITFLLNNINTVFQGQDIIPDQGKSASTLMSDGFPQVMNGGILFIFFGMMFISFILAALVPIHPVFIIFFIFEHIIYIWLGAGIANTVQVITELDVLAVEAGQYQIAIFFFHYFPYFIAVCGIGLAMVMYKVRADQGLI